MSDELTNECVGSLAQRLSVHPQSVYAWIDGKRQPRPKHYEKLIALISKLEETESRNQTLSDLCQSRDGIIASIEASKTETLNTTLVRALKFLANEEHVMLENEPYLNSTSREEEVKEKSKMETQKTTIEDALSIEKRIASSNLSETPRTKEILPSWSALRSLGGNKALHSSYIWFFITPVAANMLAEFPNPIQLSLGGSEFSVSLSLPFSWQAFFWAAASFSLANALYSWFCPWIIRDFRSYSDYEANKGYARIRAHTEARELAKIPYDIPSKTFVPVDARLRMRRPTNLDEEAVEYYDRCEELGLRSPIVRATVTGLYLIGIFLLGIVLLQNIFFVARAL